MKPVPTYELLLWERPLQQIPLPSLVNFFNREWPGKKRNVLPGNQQPKYAFVALPLSYGYLSGRQDSNLQPTN
jgi:hypothetical protein